MTQHLAKHLSITGIVQGVGYRAGFAVMARRLALSGWVRNRLDGTVEALIAGEAGAVDKMIEWAWQGPSHAQVRNIVVADAVATPEPDVIFWTLPTQ